MSASPDMTWHKGSCHCGAVEIEVQAPSKVAVDDCNCSMCVKVGYLHLIVPKSRFRLVKGEGALTTYTFNTGTAKHLFCRHCGVKSFYVPRSHPDGYSVNLRALDQSGFDEITIRPFDGRNWEANVGGLDPLTE